MNLSHHPPSPRRGLRRALSSFALFLLALPALGVLESALSVRLAQNPPAEEADALEEALNGVVAHTGLAGSYAAIDQDETGAQSAAKRDVDRLLQAAAFIQLSATPDFAVRAELSVVRDLLDSFGLQARQVATGLVPLLAEERNQNIVNTLVTRGDTHRSQGLSEWTQDFGEGARKLVRAAFLQHGAAELGARQQRIEAMKNPVDLELESMDIAPTTSMPLAGSPWRTPSPS